MAKFSNGLYTDCLEVDQPQGTYRHAKNIIESNLLGIIENEDGFKELNDILPYTLIGVIPVRDSFVVFTTNNTDSEIGLVERSGATLTYTEIYNDPALNFNTEAPIKGEFRKDVTNGRVVSWIDDNNSPRILNIDNVSNVNDISDLEIFPDINNPELTNPVTNDTGGALPVGAIIPMSRYKSVDGSTTDWFVHDHVFYINNESKTAAFNEYDGAVAGIISNKSVSFTLANSDTNFDTIVIGYIKSVGSTITALQVNEITNNVSVSVTITGNEASTDISLDEILTPNAVYNNAKAITQLAGKLYLANLTSSELPDLQSVALDIKVDYTKELIDVIQNTENHRDNLEPSFMPGEVYALYLGVELNKGGWGFYHIPGRPPVSDDTTTVTNEGLTYKKFQVENRSDQSGAYSTMGYWENDGENYPDDPSFVGTLAGDLRGQPVRHHRFPLLGYLVSTYYSGDSTVGVTKLPRLGISVSNVNIPVEIQSQIKRWKIFFAKKETTDSLVLGGDLLQFGAEKNGTIYSTGGNWTNRSVGFSLNLNITKETMRGHSLDLLIDKEEQIPTYAQFHYKLRRTKLNTAYSGFRGQGCGIAYAEQVPDLYTVAAVIDYTTPAETTRSGSSFFKRIDGFKYLPQNADSDNFSNIHTEGNFIMTINNPSTSFSGIDATIRLLLDGNSSNQFRNSSNNVDSNIGEDTMYLQYFKLISAVHNAFQSQDLIPTSGYNDPSDTSNTAIYGADTFLSYQSYLSAAPAMPVEVLTGRSLDDQDGVRMWRGYIGYSRRNFNYRHEIAGEIGTFYYGKTDPRNLFDPPLSGYEKDEHTLIDISIPHNIVEYNEDYSALNIYTIGVIKHPSVINQTQFPNTIIYSPVQGEESLEFSWRTFKSADRYVLTKNKGDIINLQGYRNRELLIHTEDSLFRTRTDAQAAVDQENIFLKSAGIFDLPPEDLVPTPEGYAGTQHKFGCILSKMGYFYPDDKRGKVFLYDGQLQEISSNGMRIFFRDFMNVAEDNPFNSNGYTAGYDERNNRFILTKKNDDLSWTVSYNPVKKVWTSFHDYIPSYMFSTTENLLYALDSNIFYIVNGDPTSTQKGQYFSDINSALIDGVFVMEDNVQFSSIKWITESYPVTVVNGQPSKTLNFTNTFTHITLRSADHCTGRITLVSKSNTEDMYAANIRNVSRNWYFDGIRDVVTTDGFVKGFYDDFEIDTTKLNTNMEWYDQRRFTDKFLICRYEYDNQVNNRILLLESDVSAVKAR